MPRMYFYCMFNAIFLHLYFGIFARQTHILEQEIPFTPPKICWISLDMERGERDGICAKIVS